MARFTFFRRKRTRAGSSFHFVRDYEALVASLIRDYPLDRAMELAVGGEYELLGQVQTAILTYAGLKNGDCVVDVGCGSGRLASALSKTFAIDYLGADIIQALLDYARTKSAPNYRFVLHRELSIPAPDASADFVCAFSLFTHLQQSESYIYLREMSRVVKPTGRILFSFLEFAEPTHWPIFEATVNEQIAGRLPHLNAFLERSVIGLWASRLGLEVAEYVDALEKRWNGQPLGQALAILRKAAA